MVTRRRKRVSRKRSVFLTPRRCRQIVTFILLLIFGVGGGAYLRGRVISVADGDTLTVFTREGERQRIRLYGIDCPESQQAGGEEATGFARSLALFAEVELTVMDKDRYGRTVAMVVLPDGTNLNEELVRNGHAWVYEAYCRTPVCVKWRALETNAKFRKIGLWAQKNPQPPWTWRQRNK